MKIETYSTSSRKRKITRDLVSLSETTRSVMSGSWRKIALIKNPSEDEVFPYLHICPSHLTLLLVDELLRKKMSLSTMTFIGFMKFQWEDIDLKVQVCTRLIPEVVRQEQLRFPSMEHEHIHLFLKQIIYISFGQMTFQPAYKSVIRTCLCAYRCPAHLFKIMFYILKSSSFDYRFACCDENALKAFIAFASAVSHDLTGHLKIVKYAFVFFDFYSMLLSVISYVDTLVQPREKNVSSFFLIYDHMCRDIYKVLGDSQEIQTFILHHSKIISSPIDDTFYDFYASEVSQDELCVFHCLSLDTVKDLLRRDIPMRQVRQSAEYFLNIVKSCGIECTLEKSVRVATMIIARGSWNKDTHHLFPIVKREVVFAVLCCFSFSKQTFVRSVSPDILLHHIIPGVVGGMDTSYYPRVTLKMKH